MSNTRKTHPNPPYRKAGPSQTRIFEKLREYSTLTGGTAWEGPVMGTRLGLWLVKYATEGTSRFCEHIIPGITPVVLNIELPEPVVACASCALELTLRYQDEIKASKTCRLCGRHSEVFNDFGVEISVMTVVGAACPSCSESMKSKSERVLSPVAAVLN